MGETDTSEFFTCTTSGVVSHSSVRVDTENIEAILDEAEDQAGDDMVGDEAEDLIEELDVNFVNFFIY